jgi:hypothetical protein
LVDPVFPSQEKYKKAKSAENLDPKKGRRIPKRN